MSERTGIQWTDHTFNSWWGCVRISDGCKHCYAADFSKRYGFDLWRPDGERRFFGDKHWNEPLKWNRAAEAEGRRARVFCASMADVFEDHPALREPRDRLFRLIEETPFLDWQLLTKRPENIPSMVPRSWIDSSVGPPRNVWFGTSAEDQQRFDERWPHLQAIPAAVRFLSLEPLLGPIDLRGALFYMGKGRRDAGILLADWVIVGGESGPGARPCDLAWVRSVRDQCKAAGTACFIKQIGARPVVPNTEDPDRWGTYVRWQEDIPSGQGSPMEIRTTSPKGGDPAEWPEDLRVREFPR